MSNLVQHMEREFRAAGLMSGTDPQAEKLVADIRGLMNTLVAQGHSGSSVTQTLQLFDRLVHLKPLVPLIGTPDEWTPTDMDPTVLQNVRCTSVFKDLKDGEVRDVGMKPVYVYPDGVTVTRSTDPAPVVHFPYMPGFPPVIGITEDGAPLA